MPICTPCCAFQAVRGITSGMVTQLVTTKRLPPRGSTPHLAFIAAATNAGGFLVAESLLASRK